jgi:hypothetical protein
VYSFIVIQIFFLVENCFSAKIEQLFCQERFLKTICRSFFLVTEDHVDIVKLLLLRDKKFSERFMNKNINMQNNDIIENLISKYSQNYTIIIIFQLPRV